MDRGIKMPSGLIGIADVLAPQYLAKLKANHPDLSLVTARSVGELVVIPGCQENLEVLITTGVAMPVGVLDQLPSLRWVHGLIAGVDRFVEPLARRPDVILTSTRGIHGPQIAEMVLTQMLVLSRDVMKALRYQREKIWDPWLPRMLLGRTVGVVGLGPSGLAIGRMCDVVGMRVVGVSDHTTSAPGFAHIAGYDELDNVASEVDFLVLSLPHTPETDKLIGHATLSKMRPSAYLVNVARGGVVDEEALVEVLQNGGIAGAALDVFTEEPLPTSSKLWSLDNVFVTSHLAGRTIDYADRALTVLAPNLAAYLEGRIDEMLNVVAR